MYGTVLVRRYQKLWKKQEERKRIKEQFSSVSTRNENCDVNKYRYSLTQTQWSLLILYAKFSSGLLELKVSFSRGPKLKTRPDNPSNLVANNVVSGTDCLAGCLQALGKMRRIYSGLVYLFQAGVYEHACMLDGESVCECK